MRAGAVRSRVRMHGPWGWIEPPEHSTVPSGVNLRREVLDPLIREHAAQTPGVELLLGRTVSELLRDGEQVRGVVARDARRRGAALRARLVVGADGRGSRVAKLAGVRERTAPPRALRLRRLLRRAARPSALRTPRSGCSIRTWRRPSRPTAASTFYAAMPAKDRVERVPRGPGEGARRVHRRGPRRAADPRLAHGRAAAGQAGHDERRAHADGARASRSSATPRWRSTRCGASAAAGRCSRPNGSRDSVAPALAEPDRRRAPRVSSRAASRATAAATRARCAVTRR